MERASNPSDEMIYHGMQETGAFPCSTALSQPLKDKQLLKFNKIKGVFTSSLLLAG